MICQCSDLGSEIGKIEGGETVPAYYQLGNGLPDRPEIID